MSIFNGIKTFKRDYFCCCFIWFVLFCWKYRFRHCHSQRFFLNILILPLIQMNLNKMTTFFLWLYLTPCLYFRALFFFKTTFFCLITTAKKNCNKRSFDRWSRNSERKFTVQKIYPNILINCKKKSVRFSYLYAANSHTTHRTFFW